MNAGQIHKSSRLMSCTLLLGILFFNRNVLLRAVDESSFYCILLFWIFQVCSTVFSVNPLLTILIGPSDRYLLFGKFQDLIVTFGRAVLV